MEIKGRKLKTALLVGCGQISYHHNFYVNRLAQYSDIVSVISFNRKRAKRTAWAKARQIRNPGLLCGMAIGKKRNQRVTETRRRAFAEYEGILQSYPIANVSNNSEASQVARELGVDFLFQLTAGIIREPLLSVSPLGVFSSHHGIIPLLKGISTPFWAIYLDRPECLGITLQRLCEKLDDGEVFGQSCIQVHPEDRTFADLVLRLDYAGGELIPEAIQRLSQNEPPLPKPDGKKIYLSNPGLMEQLRFAGRLRSFIRKYKTQ